MTSLLLLPGDGPGPSLTGIAETVLSAVAGDIELVHGDIGFDAYERTGEYLPAETLDLARECGTAICGPLNLYKDGFGKAVNLMDSLRGSLDLYATVRVFRTLLGDGDIHATIWGSNTSRSFDVSETPDVDGITISKYISSGTYKRMMTRALADLKASGKRRVDCITRDDLFPDSSGMFSETFDGIFSGEGLETGHANIQRWASKVVRDPAAYEYLICADLYTNVAAGILAGLTGGNHLSPVGYVGDSVAIIVPGLMSTFDGVDPNNLNPTSTILSVAMALFNLGRKDEAERISDSLKGTYAAGILTPDVGGSSTQEAFMDAFLSRL